ncbi:helix-turn-helix transcriptional regulator [Pseudomonas carnis]|uniref:helix-turn-helix transcriptional regulator n=1 Tax=Pseudomonas TaxID=286 RepID=UPI000F5770D5|nr:MULTISPECIES: helix-turn-helix transcriptional regulator [Pseudomonas]MBY8952575.1 helix-turn-helix transcriptional regulator [Pseudomonas carnis]
MVNQQAKEACTGRRSMTLRAVSAEYSGVRLRALLTECKIAPMDFAVFLKVSPQRLNNWFARGIPHSRLDRIARLLSVNADWLETGAGEKFRATRG